MSVVPAIPQRTQSNTRAEHLSDHNALHTHTHDEFTQTLVVGATRSAGNITLNGTSWGNVDTGLDLVLPAVSGDWIEVSLSGRMAAAGGTNHQFFDIATIVAGSPVNFFGPGGGVTDEGLNGLRIAGANDAGIVGSYLRQLVGGDISGGNVTLRLRTRQDAAGNRTFVAGTTNPFKWWAKNLGQG